MARGATRAEQLRAHREAFILAQELGITPKSAERILQARASRSQWEESSRRLASKMAEPPRARLADDDDVLRQAQDERDDREPWMMRD